MLNVQLPCRAVWTLGLAVVIVFAASGIAQADPLLTGEFSITGNILRVDGETGVYVAAGSATGLDFIAASGSTPTPGVDGEFLVNAASGSLSGLLAQTGTIRDFAFAGLGSADFPNLDAPLTSFLVVGGGSFTLNSVAILFQGPSALVVEGDGLFVGPDFDDTPGRFTLTAQAGTVTSTFSATTTTIPGPKTTVPEPRSALLLGMGLAAVGLAYSRRKTVIEQ